MIAKKETVATSAINAAKEATIRRNVKTDQGPLQEEEVAKEDVESIMTADLAAEEALIVETEATVEGMRRIREVAMTTEEMTDVQEMIIEEIEITKKTEGMITEADAEMTKETIEGTLVEAKMTEEVVERTETGEITGIIEVEMIGGIKDQEIIMHQRI